MAKKSASRFLHSIDKYAKKKKLKLAEEIEQIENERLQKEELKIFENVRLLMMSKLANTKNEIAMQVYKVRTSSKQKVYNLKTDIWKKVFDDCKIRIENFTKTPEYCEYIKGAVCKAEKVLGDNLSVFLREKDLNLINLISDFILKHNIVLNYKIKDGGVLFCKNDCWLDFTFDTRILEQKKWFLENCMSKLV